MDNEHFIREIHAAKRLSRRKEFVIEWREQGGIESILNVLQQPSDSKLLGSALSTLANCVLLDERSRKAVLEKDGVKSLAQIVESLEDTQIVNRAARALANLCSNEEMPSCIKQHGLIDVLLRRVKDVSDALCLQSMLRALQKILENFEFRADFIRSEYVMSISTCLNSENEDVRSLSLKLMQSLIPGLNDEIAYRMIETGLLEGVVNASSILAHPKRELGITCLAALARHPAIRVSLTSIGGIELFRGEIKDLAYSRSFFMSLRALCMCAKEAVNRNRITRCGALSDMVKILNLEKFSAFFPEIVTALVWFLFDEASIRIMVENGIVRGLIGYFSTLTVTSTSCPTTVRQSQERASESVNFDHGCMSSESQQHISHYASNADMKDSKDPVVEPRTVSSETRVFEMVTDEKVDCAPQKSAQDSATPILLHPSQPWPFSPSWSISSPETSPPGARSPEWGYYQHSPPRCFSPHVFSLSRPTSPDIDGVSTSSVDSEECFTKPTLSQRHSADAFFDSLNETSARDSSPFGPELGNLPLANLSSPQSPRSQLDESYSLENYYGSADGVPAMIHGKRGPIHDVLLLLSRLSQMTDPSRILVNPFCIDALLHYICVSVKPEPKAVRLLNRLTLNPNCFEAFFKHNLVTKIHLVLNRSYKIDELCYLLDSAEAAGRVESSEDEPMEISGADAPRESIDIKPTNLTEKSLGMTTKGRTQQERGNTQSRYGMTWTPRIPSPDSARTCELLLSNLKAQTESSFGKGVLTHVMLTRSRSEREIHAVALPLLCRSRSLLRKMFLELKALEILIELVSKEETPSEMFILACEGLSSLAYIAGVTLDDKCNDKESTMTTERSGSATLQGQTVVNSAAGALVAGQKRPADTPIKKFSKHCKLDITKPKLQTQKCCIFRLDSGTHCKVSQDILVHSSRVFEAMLSNRYTDSTEKVIDIKGISERSFLMLLHHMSGCKLDLDFVCCSDNCYFQGQTISERVDKSKSHDTLVWTSSSIPYKASLNLQLYGSGTADIKLSCGDRVSEVMELLVCSERYMVECLKHMCEEWLKRNVTDMNVVDIYLVGCHNNAYKLHIYCLKYIFVGIKDPWLRIKSVREVLKSTEKCGFLDYLRNLLIDSILSVM